MPAWPRTLAASSTSATASLKMGLASSMAKRGQTGIRTATTRASCRRPAAFEARFEEFLTHEDAFSNDHDGISSPHAEYHALGADHVGHHHRRGRGNRHGGHRPGVEEVGSGNDSKNGSE